MKKILIEFLATCVLFAGIWLLSAQVNWVKVLRIEKVSKTTEEKLGELLQTIIEKEGNRVTKKGIVNPIDSLLSHICMSNGIKRETIQLHVIKNSSINAFAMPGGHLVVYTGLIEACTQPEELSGVIAHEVAHLEKRHVMKKLIKEIGLSALLSAAGGTSGEVIKETLRHLSSTAYDRELEKEADLQAVYYLENGGISAVPFAEFMYMLATQDRGNKYLSWMSTHPDSEERAAYIQEAADTILQSEVIITQNTWQSLQNAVKNL